MSETCDILGTTVGGQEPTEIYWVRLKISSSIYFVSVTDGGCWLAAVEAFLL